MRNSTKLKIILQKNVVGLSFSADKWEVSTINTKSNKRVQFEGKSFSDVLNKAYRGHIQSVQEEERGLIKIQDFITSNPQMSVRLKNILSGYGSIERIPFAYVSEINEKYFLKKLWAGKTSWNELQTILKANNLLK